jgi:hypothetical protein
MSEQERTDQETAPMADAATAVFAITAASSAAPLDSTRKGSASFTVSNASGRALRGRARLFTANQVASPWLTIAGDAERDFPVAGVQQYTVQIAVPTTASPGSYSFRLDEVGVENPDEQYAQGPSVAFEVPAPPPPPPPPPAIPWWIFVVIAAVVLAIAGIVAFLLLRNVTPPDVVGQTRTNAEATIKASSLAEGTLTTRVSVRGTPDIVVAQTPVAGTPVPRNSRMDLVVSALPRLVLNRTGVQVAPQQAIDLDTGAPGAASDIQFVVQALPQATFLPPQSIRSIQPINGAKLVGGLPTTTDHDDCVTQLRSVSPGQTIPLAQAIPADQVVCVQKANGHVAAVKVTAPLLLFSPFGTPLQIDVTTWDQ